MSKGNEVDEPLNAPDSQPPAWGGPSVGNYEVLRELGRGGMGVVYLGRHKTLGVSVALKVLREDLTSDPTFRIRFTDEARLGAKIRSPCVVQILDLLDFPDGRPCIVMEYCEGRTLDALAGTEPLPPEVAISVLEQLCEGLGAAHRMGIVHRDVKADNVIVLMEDGEPRVKLADFGVAKLHQMAASGATIPGTVVGTPHYMSPEQARGEKVDARGDVYAVGILAFRLLMGRVPFVGDDLTAVLVQHLTAPPPEMPGVHPAIVKVIYRSLAKDKADRYQDAAEMQQALTVALAESQADPDAPVPESKKPISKPPAMSVTGSHPMPESTIAFLSRAAGRLTQDRYGFLGVNPGAAQAKVRSAIEQMQKRLDEANREALLAEMKILESLQRRLTEARADLWEPFDRLRYDAKILNFLGIARAIRDDTIDAVQLTELHSEYAKTNKSKLREAEEKERAATELAQSGDHAGALKLIEAALQRAPLSLDIHRRLASLQNMLGIDPNKVASDPTPPPRKSLFEPSPLRPNPRAEKTPSPARSESNLELTPGPGRLPFAAHVPLSPPKAHPTAPVKPSAPAPPRPKAAPAPTPSHTVPISVAKAPIYLAPMRWENKRKPKGDAAVPAAKKPPSKPPKNPRTDAAPAEAAKPVETPADPAAQVKRPWWSRKK